MRAFVLAAGLGVRMGPLGELLHKALLPLCGVPVIRFALDRLRQAGVKEAVVNLHHRAEEIQSELGKSACSIKVRYSFEPKILGTAGGIKQEEAFLRETGEPFFVLNADIVSNASLKMALERHQAGGFLATLVLRASPNAKKFGLLAVDEMGRLRKFLCSEAPGQPAGSLTEAMFTGQSVLSPDFLDYIPPARPCGISEEVYPSLIKGGAPIGALLTDAYWADVGTPAQYLCATDDLLSGRFVPAMDWPGGGDVLVEGPTMEWGEGVVHPPIVIGKGVSLSRGASAGPFAVLSDGATLGEGASASRSVLFSKAVVGEKVSLEKCIVGPNASASSRNGKRYFKSVFLRGQDKFDYF